MPGLLDRKARILAPLIGAKRGPQLSLAITEVAGEIEWAQARLVGPAAYAEAATRVGRSPTLAVERVADVYRKYQDEKRKRHVIDFDDLVRLCARCQKRDWSRPFVKNHLADTPLPSPMPVNKNP